jgi:hypothetical protein
VPEGTSDSYPSKIDCVSQTFCVAVGTSSESDSSDSFDLIDEFDGTSWTAEDAPNPNPVDIPQPELAGVSCTSDTSCVALGMGFAAVLDGTTWSIEPVPSPSGATQIGLGGISCVSATFCTGVGCYEKSTGKQVPQAVTWDGADWTLESTASLPKNKSAGLGDVACFSSSSCLAVGSHMVKQQTGSALLEQESSGAWSTQVAPTVDPMTLTPNSGGPGTKVTVSGYGFSPNSAVKVTYEDTGRGNVVLCTSTTDASGTYSCSAKIPKARAGARGTHDVVAQNGANLTAVALFTLA